MLGSMCTKIFLQIMLITAATLFISINSYATSPLYVSFWIDREGILKEASGFPELIQERLSKDFENIILPKKSCSGAPEGFDCVLYIMDFGRVIANFICPSLTEKKTSLVMNFLKSIGEQRLARPHSNAYNRTFRTKLLLSKEKGWWKLSNIYTPKEANKSVPMFLYYILPVEDTNKADCGRWTRPFLPRGNSQRTH